MKTRTGQSALGVGLALAVLTGAALVLVYAGMLPVRALVWMLVALAAAQVYLQLRVYMHLRDGRYLYGFFFVAGIVVAVLIGWSAVYLMWVH